jgi:DNA primase
MPWVDYRHIKASVSIEKVLARYNIQLKPTSDHHLAGPCPIPSHAGDRSNKTAFHVDTKKNVFNCFTHCGGGNILDLVAKMEGCEIRKAAELLNEWFLIENELTLKNERPADNNGNKPLTFELKGLKPKHPFLLKEKGLSLATVNEFGVGFCSKGLLAGWIAIPIHNVKGESVAYLGRNGRLLPACKY